MAWWDYEKPAGAPGTHAAGDDGEDVSTPDHTAESFPVAGTILDASYHDFGGLVVLKPDPGQAIPPSFDPYFVHIDHEYVQRGQHVPAGAIIGDSGGGVGDLVLHNGVVQPAQNQSWYNGHSTNYHSEFGAFYDPTVGGSMAEFNRGWGNRARQLDPRPLINKLRGGGVLLSSDFPPPAGVLGGSSAAAGNKAGKAAAQKLAELQLPNLSRLVAGAAGIGLVGLGLLVALWPEGALGDSVNLAGIL